MYRRVLVSYDDSLAARRALQEAIKLIDTSQAVMRLVHVVDMRQVTDGSGEFSDTANLQASMEERGVKVLARAIQACKKAGITAETAMLEGWEPSIAPPIVKDAMQWKADVIVMGVHVRSPLSSLVHTNTAEEVLKLSEMPVLLVREPKDSLGI